MRNAGKQLDTMILEALAIGTNGDLRKLTLKARAITALSAWLRCEEGLPARHDLKDPVVPSLAAL